MKLTELKTFCKEASKPFPLRSTNSTQPNLKAPHNEGLFLFLRLSPPLFWRGWLNWFRGWHNSITLITPPMTPAILNRRVFSAAFVTTIMSCHSQPNNTILNRLPRKSESRYHPRLARHWLYIPQCRPFHPGLGHPKHCH